MSAPNRMLNAVDPDGKWLHRVDTRPSGTEAWLTYLVGNTNDLPQTAAVTSAMYPSVVVGSNLLFLYNTLTLSIGILVTGQVMLKGSFNKPTAYVGLATGILGIVSVAGPILVNALSVTIIASLLTTA